MVATSDRGSGDKAAGAPAHPRLPPIGFWSYARQDDELSDGELTRLRSQVRSALQQQFGRTPIEIFQDTSAIPHGAKWEEEIRHSLFNSTFFIPILTPNFLQSEWCCREVQLFLERQTQLYDIYPDLPRESRIFPIHYVDVRRADVLNPDILRVLDELQWFDFRELRYETGPIPRRAVADFASSIRDLLLINVAAPSAAKQDKASLPDSGPAATPVLNPAATDSATARGVEADEDNAPPAARRAVLQGLTPLLALGGTLLLVIAAVFLLPAIRPKATVNPPPSPPQKPTTPTATATAADDVPSIYAGLTGRWGLQHDCTTVTTITATDSGIAMRDGTAVDTFTRDPQTIPTATGIALISDRQQHVAFKLRTADKLDVVYPDIKMEFVRCAGR